MISQKTQSVSITAPAFICQDCKEKIRGFGWEMVDEQHERKNNSTSRRTQDLLFYC